MWCSFCVREETPSLVWFYAATVGRSAPTDEMVQLEGALKVPLPGGAMSSRQEALSRHGETESQVFAPCGPAGMGTNPPSAMVPPLHVPSGQAAGPAVCLTRAGVRLPAASAVVRRQTELASLGLWWGLHSMGRFATLNPSGVAPSHYRGWAQGAGFPLENTCRLTELGSSQQKGGVRLSRF